MAEYDSKHDQNSYRNPNKGTLCKFGCGTRITFDSNTLSKNGKIIPLNLDGSFHDCPARNQEGGFPRRTPISENRVQKAFDKVEEGSKHASESKSFFNQLLENIEHSNMQLERILVEQGQVKELLENITQGLQNLLKKEG